VTVVGNARTPVDDVVAATSILAGMPLLDLDLAGAESGVEELPWVRKADVERRLDGEIIVRVTEREPVLALPVVGPGAGAGAGDGDVGSGRHVLIDQLGQQLELVNGPPDGFLPVVGVEASGRPGESAPEETGLILSLIQSLPPSLIDQVSAMTVSEGDLYLELASGGRANVGDSSLLGEKIQALETVLARVDLACVSMIDLRVPSAAAVRRVESAEGACL
ncbi:MAG: FtsQ-type POTRA domain-containing protein, partial [Acidimicrobiia bacterium]|nr:FtsQ-type POTRA domain-containing protein [Acidimicrobiia bacterium]